METEGSAAAAWIEAGFTELAEHGIEGVRIEVLAKRLGVTKGGFYWHFKDRPALLAAMLERWRQARTASIGAQAARAGVDAHERLRGLIRLYVEHPNPKGMAIELAIRQWARREPAAAEAAAAVDQARLAEVERLYAELGLSMGEAAARALLFYSFLFGQGLLFADGAGPSREALIDRCSALLTHP